MPRLKLNLPPLVVSQNTPPPAPKVSHELKKEDVGKLIKDIEAQPKSSFRNADIHGSYHELSQGGYKNEFSGYKLSNVPFGDVFIHANKDNESREYLGDKIHISIDKAQLSSGFDDILPILLSEDSPIDKWKVTDLNRCPPDSRVAVGAQITLYVKADKESGYVPAELKKVKDFLEQIELTLGQSNTTPGEKPQSDISAANWNFISYRNEYRSDREGGASHQLFEEPFFQVISS
ncbi:VirA protein [Photobacterium damselae]|uniref:Hydrophilic protein virA protein n=2 Tax=Photobacterium damselae TaxID=38293 RepID=D0Z4Z0_PHODD|nr:VirA protein [Photobacterium damselae]EEZ39207.1 hydrophilic protein virA protein [Photobacterium damselae subsp. damselae CIP 102761]PSW77172.1 hydrophilic protein virA protein [Photobacterium damselae]SPY45053.1 Phosphothreonine lyase ospF [Photobacterium damselae]